MCISLSDLFHEASYHSGLSMLFKRHIFIFYNWVVFDCICMPYLPYHLFMGSELSPISRLLWIMLLWTLPLFSRSVVSDSLPPSGLQTLGFPVLHLSPTLLKLMSIELMMPSNYLIFCHLLLLLPSIFPNIRVFSSESALHIRWSKYWSFNFNFSLSNEYSRFISFRIDWFDHLSVQAILKCHLQYHSLKASIL